VVNADHPFAEIETSLKRAAGALKRAGVPFLLGGGLAVWVRGGPETRKDLDFMVKQDDAERALRALVDEGMRPEYPPEDWLLKAWDGEVLIDLIFSALGLPVTDEVIARGEEMNVFSIQMAVMSLEDVLSTKLLSLNEHYLCYESLLQASRAVREQVDWGEIWERTRHSPYARVFFAILRELDIVRAPATSDGKGKQIRVVGEVSRS
jgi:hypothetical protein